MFGIGLLPPFSSLWSFNNFTQDQHYLGLNFTWSVHCECALLAADVLISSFGVRTVRTRVGEGENDKVKMKVMMRLRVRTRMSDMWKGPGVPCWNTALLLTCMGKGGYLTRGCLKMLHRFHQPRIIPYNTHSSNYDAQLTMCRVWRKQYF